MNVNYQEALIREVLYGPNTQLPWLKESYKKMRVLVCGGRDYNDIDKVWKTLYDISHEGGHPYPNDITDLIEGGAKGADSLARYWAMYNYTTEGKYIRLHTYKADWKKHGKSAGPIRNQTMLEQGKPDLVVAFPGGRGTADMVKRATQAGIPVREVK